MKYLFLLFTLLLLLSPALSTAQQVTAQDSITAVVAADTAGADAEPAQGADHNRYARKGPKDNIWKLSVGLSLVLMIIVLMLITRRKKK